LSAGALRGFPDESEGFRERGADFNGGGGTEIALFLSPNIV
jgi:hypothetical protein